MAQTQEEYEMVVAEYNGAQEFTPVAKGPSRMNEVRDRGKNSTHRLTWTADPEVVARLALSRLESPGTVARPKPLQLQKQLLPGFLV